MKMLMKRVERRAQTHTDIYRVLRWQLRRFQGKTTPEDALVAVFTLYAALHATRSRVRKDDPKAAHRKLMARFDDMVIQFDAAMRAVRDPVCVPKLSERKRA